jgi:hypothetical protein
MIGRTSPSSVVEILTWFAKVTVGIEMAEVKAFSRIQ